MVTGAAGGIGLAIAGALARDGLHVVLADRSEAVLEATARLVAEGLRASGHVVDVADETQLLALAAALDADGGCDVLVNNAGVHPKRGGGHYALPDIDTAQWEQVLRVNLTAPFILCRELVPGMQRRGWGRIINIASRAGRTFIAPAGMHYSASKAGLIGLTRQIAGSYAAHGITANCIAPGRIETPLSNQSSPDVIRASVAAIPAQRLGSVDEIAATARFLASDGAGYITGVCVDVNGGAFIG
nr:SDR family NAD(P)-dependent oxidoreductase [Schlegelella koreensis]